MWLDSFFLLEGDPTLLLYGSYDPLLVGRAHVVYERGEHTGSPLL